ncbi:RraA family protein [Celerinatantimonas sp. MCCC 1A17872]|uniref:RraA family protein n=1 Tax=Celerinatantimonas sp. MCCC 1A17872 TaxID=3177514 RepID=UPI0038CBE481
MIDLNSFAEFSTCDYGDVLPEGSYMDCGIKALWSGGPRLVGTAYTVKCDPGDNLMVHAAIYQAPAGSVLVINGGDNNFAVAGGHVCAAAAERGIRGFIIDGVIRDVVEIEEMGFAVYARGNVPKPGRKEKLGEVEQPITCGGITVNNGDIVIADEEGIVAFDSNQAEEILAKAKEAAIEGNMPLAEWKVGHYKKISALVASLTKQAEQK